MCDILKSSHIHHVHALIYQWRWTSVLFQEADALRLCDLHSGSHDTRGLFMYCCFQTWTPENWHRTLSAAGDNPVRAGRKNHIRSNIWWHLCSPSQPLWKSSRKCLQWLECMSESSYEVQHFWMLGHICHVFTCFVYASCGELLHTLTDSAIGKMEATVRLCILLPHFPKTFNLQSALAHSAICLFW